MSKTREHLAGASPMQLHVEQLSDRIVPAVVDVTGGVLTFAGSPGEANVVTISVTGTAYAFNDPSNKIILTPSAMAAGFKGSNTFTVSGQDSKVNGIVVSLGDGSDTLNLRSVNDPISVLGDDGADAVNISSTAPNNTGHLLGILAAVSVDAETLVVSDQGAGSGNAAVSIDATTISGFAGPTDNVDIAYSNVSSLRIIGSSSVYVAESFTISAPSCSTFQLDGNAGDESITVDAWDAGCVGTFTGYAGFDSLTIYSGVTVYGTADGFETEWFNSLGYGDLV